MMQTWSRLFGVIVMLSVIPLSACKRQQKQPGPTQIAIPVNVMVTKSKLINIKYQSIGTLFPREAPIIRNRLPGQIEELLVHEGEKVQKGQVLIRIKQEEMDLQLKQAQAKLVQAQALLNEKSKSVDRANKLIGKGYVSKEQYDQAVAEFQTAQADITVADTDLARAQYQTKQTNIQSPIIGHIGKIVVSVGEYVPAGTALLNIVNHEELRAELPFPEKRISELAPGQKVVLTSPAVPNQVITSSITSITPDIDPETRAVNVIVFLKNQHNWKPGSSVKGTVFTKSIQAILVPEDTILTRPNGKIIYVVKNNKAIATPVETGAEVEGEIVITKGLQNGDQVVVTGNAYLSDGATVSIQK